RLAAAVFIAGVEASDETAPAIHHQDLAVVAEVDLQAVAPGPRGEGMHRNTTRAQCRDVRARQVVAADAVIEDAYAHAGGGPLQQHALQLAPGGVVMDD